MFFQRKSNHVRASSAVGRRYRLSFEQLETRVVPAGTTLSNGVLTLTGDLLSANNFVMRTDGGLITITESGSPFAIFDATQVYQDIIINLGEGNDKVDLIAENTAGNGFWLGGGLTINAGGGNDKVSLLANNTAGNGFNVRNLTIDTGEGNNSVTLDSRSAGIDGFRVLESLSIIGGSGNDKVSLLATNTAGNGFAGLILTINTFGGNDKVSLLAKNTAGNGFDVGNLIIDSGDGNNKVTLGNTRDGQVGISAAGSLSITCGIGNDKVSLLAKSSHNIGFFADGLAINTGAGNNSVTLDSSSAGNFGFVVTNDLAITSGAGNDKLSLLAKDADVCGFHVGGLTIDTGDGNNSVTLDSRIGSAGSSGFHVVNDVSMTGDLSITGGAGNDKVSLLAKNTATNGSFRATSLAIHANAGDDKVTVKETGAGTFLTVAIMALFDGGSHIQGDSIFDNVFGFAPSTHLNFEKVGP